MRRCRISFRTDRGEERRVWLNFAKPNWKTFKAATITL